MIQFRMGTTPIQEHYYSIEEPFLCRAYTFMGRVEKQTRHSIDGPGSPQELWTQQAFWNVGSDDQGSSPERPTSIGRSMSAIRNSWRSTMLCLCWRSAIRPGDGRALSVAMMLCGRCRKTSKCRLYRQPAKTADVTADNVVTSSGSASMHATFRRPAGRRRNCPELLRYVRVEAIEKRRLMESFYL